MLMIHVLMHNIY